MLQAMLPLLLFLPFAGAIFPNLTRHCAEEGPGDCQSFLACCRSAECGSAAAKLASCAGDPATGTIRLSSPQTHCQCVDATATGAGRSEASLRSCRDAASTCLQFADCCRRFKVPFHKAREEEMCIPMISNHPSRDPGKCRPKKRPTRPSKLSRGPGFPHSGSRICPPLYSRAAPTLSMVAWLLTLLFGLAAAQLNPTYPDYTQECTQGRKSCEGFKECCEDKRCEPGIYLLYRCAKKASVFNPELSYCKCSPSRPTPPSSSSLYPNYTSECLDQAQTCGDFERCCATRTCAAGVERRYECGYYNHNLEIQRSKALCLCQAPVKAAASVAPFAGLFILSAGLQWAAYSYI